MPEWTVYSRAECSLCEHMLEQLAELLGPQTPVQVIQGSNTPVRHLVLSDGLASVSVFIEPRSPQTEAMRGLAKVGAAFAYSRDLDGHQVTAVGEVPAATVEAIAEAVTKEDAALAPVARDQQRPQ